MKPLKKEQVLRKLRAHQEELRTQFKVSALYLFGSIARGEGTKRSDVDLLVDFASTEIGIFQFLELKDRLEKILGSRVDLVTRDALKEWMRPQVEKDMILAA